MTFAMVNVLPEPVTPSSVWYRSPRSRPPTSVSIACGWSPVGSKSETSLNGRERMVGEGWVVTMPV